MRAAGTTAVLTSLGGTLLCACGARALAQEVALLPFAPGERLEYTIRVNRVRASGHGAMTVGGPAIVRGQSTWVLRSEFRAGMGPFKASGHSESWLDPERMAALRFEKREQHVLVKGEEIVELYPDERRWLSDDGTEGESSTTEPLDELSFIYFLRTLSFGADTAFEFDRHYQPDRNPVSIRVIARDTVETVLGALPVIVVEMRVRDPKRYKDGTGTIRIHLSDDARRIPVRIESEMPVLGKAVMTLASVSGKP